MSKLLTILSFIILSVCYSHSQVQVFANTLRKSNNLDKTIFVYRNSDTARLADLEALVKSNWTFCDITMMSIDSFLNVKIENGQCALMISYNYATSAVVYTGTGPNAGTVGPTSNFVGFYLVLYQKQDNDWVGVSSANLSVHGKALVQVVRSKKTQQQIVYNLYDNIEVFSWNDAYLATVLSTISDKLSKGENYSHSNTDQKNVSLLASSTLYIAEEVQSKQNRFTGAETKLNYKVKIDRLYDYSFEIVSKDTINEFVRNGEPVYYLMFQKLSHGKAIIVLNTATNRIIYYNWVPGKYKFTGKDMKTINELIGNQAQN